jgi:hypothetical protein
MPVKSPVLGKVYSVKKNPPPDSVPILAFCPKMATWVMTVFDSRRKRFQTDLPNWCKLVYWTLIPPQDLKSLESIIEV